MKNGEEILKDLEKVLYGDKNGFEIILRSGEGIDKLKFEEICNNLNGLENIWRKNDCVPKKFMRIFLEFKEGCENSLGLYNEDMQIEILQHVDKIVDLVNKIIYD